MATKTSKKKLKIPHRRRHSFFYRLLRPLVVMFLKIKFKYRFKRAKVKDMDNYIVLSNHTTDYDPVLVASSFRRPMYFVGSEHITRWQTAYRLLNFCFAPIMRYKGSVASSTVKDILRRIWGGANVCLFAEGVRSWDGETGPILPSTAKLIKSAGCGLVTYRLTGGYFVSPNWSEGNGVRRGKISGAPVNYYTREQIASMSEEEIYNIITKDLYENAYLTQYKEKSKYTGKALAERLENLIFICPKCKSHDTLHSHDSKVSCCKCNLEFGFNEYGEIEGLQEKNVFALAQWQNSEIATNAKDKMVYTCPNATLSTLSIDHKKTLILEGKLSLSPKTLKCGDREFQIKDIVDLAIFGRHGIVFSHDNTYYEITPDKNYSAYKFVLYYKAIINKSTKKEK